jgi:signal transduction histidine kinase
MFTLEDLRPVGLFEGLTDAQVTELGAAADDVRIEPGQVLFRQGDPAEAWWMLVDGAIDLHRLIGQEDMVMARMRTPGQWAGGFRAWDQHGIYLGTGVGVLAGRALRLPAVALRRLTDTWFPFGSHLIGGVFTTARSIEATARQRESLVTLGTLAAGLAHELNNPAAAATRAVDALQAAGPALEVAVGQLAAAGVAQAQLAAIDELRRRAAAAMVPRSALELSDLEDELTSWLEDHHVEQAWMLAPALAAGGIDPAWCDEAAVIVSPAALQPALEWVSTSSSLTGLLAEVKDATGRIFELVDAMKSYSQMDRASAQRVDVREGLESTLVVLGQAIPDGVVVVRDYDGRTPVVDGYPGELNQVWTHLVRNALDALAGAGTLRVSTRGDDGAAVVEIGDTGPGMPPAVAARAFEPFFTTKPVGTGTGLGLDIARRIVEERHGGSITIDSRPGDTVLRVRLPARARRP